MKKKLPLSCLLFMLILLLTACGRKAEITIHDGTVNTKVEVSLPKTVDEILKEAEISVAEKDEVNPSGGTELQEAAEITIRRRWKLTITTDGSDTKEVEILSGSTVKDVLEKEGITPAENQSLNVKEEDPVQEGMTIEITTSNGVTVVHDGKIEKIEFGVGTVGERGDELGKAGSLQGVGDFGVRRVGTIERDVVAHGGVEDVRVLGDVANLV